MDKTLALTIASTKELIRSRELLAQALIPLGFLVILALFKDLDLRTGALSVSMLDFMAIGVGVMLVAVGNAHSFLAVIATHKSEGVLKRIAVTPVSRAGFIVAEVAPRVVAGLVLIWAFLAVSAAMGAHIRFSPNLWGVLPVTFMITMTGLSWSFLVAGVTRNPQNANALDSFVVFPLYLLSGAMFPIAAFPGWLQPIAEAVPYAGLLKTMRGVVLEGAGLTGYVPELALGAAWLAVFFAVAVRRYRFTPS